MSKFFRLLEDIYFCHIVFNTLRICFHAIPSKPVSEVHDLFSDTNVCKYGMKSAWYGWCDFTFSQNFSQHTKFQRPSIWSEWYSCKSLYPRRLVIFLSSFSFFPCPLMVALKDWKEEREFFHFLHSYCPNCHLFDL